MAGSVESGVRPHSTVELTGKCLDKTQVSWGRPCSEVVGKVKESIAEYPKPQML